MLRAIASVGLLCGPALAQGTPPSEGDPQPLPADRAPARPTPDDDPVVRKTDEGLFESDTPVQDTVVGTGDRDVTTPEAQWIAAEVRVGFGWLTGGVVRDTRAVRGTQVALRRDLDLDRPEGVGNITLHLRPIQGWRITAELGWTSFEGRANQSGGSVFNPTPPPLTFDGVTFVSQTLESELDILMASIGIWKRLDALDHATFDLGFGAHFLGTELDIEAVGGGSVGERSQAATPWLGAMLAMPFTPWLHFEVGGRFGFLWAGDNARYYVHTLVDLTATAWVPIGPGRLGLHLNYLLVNSHERVHRHDEIVGISLVATSVTIGFRF